MGEIQYSRITREVDTWEEVLTVGLCSHLGISWRRHVVLKENRIWLVLVNSFISEWQKT